MQKLDYKQADLLLNKLSAVYLQGDLIWRIRRPED